MKTYQNLCKEINDYKIKTQKFINEKSITMEQFFSYHDYLSQKKTPQTPFISIWKYDFFEDFKKNSKEYPFNKVLPSIINIVDGNFNKSTGKIYKEGPCAFFSYPIYEDNILIYTIHFVICFKLDSRKKEDGNYESFVNEIILFSDIKNLNEQIDPQIKAKLLFQIGGSTQYPQVKFDKLVLVTKKIDMFFSNKNKNEKGNLPLGKILTEEKNYFDTITVNNKKYEISLQSLDFEQEDLIVSLINEIENCPFNNLILNLIENDKWGLRLSKQEKNLVKDKNCFILSGRPGTGKTTVILIKLFSIFFNYMITKSLRLNGELNWKDNQKGIKEDNLKKQFRIIFTSLSQNLCFKVQDIFRDIVQKQGIDIIFSDFRQDKIKMIHSFRDISEYPLFINFRKLMFMIDGSITFQFFKRKNLRIFQNLNPNCSFEYSSDTIYECNNYSNFSYKFDNEEQEQGVFYTLPEVVKRSPIIEKKEANENTFIMFYKNYLDSGGVKLDLDPLEIYSQINSVIKGSLTSHLSKNNCISLDEYLKKGRKLTDLPCLSTIYDICIKYENWKEFNNYFDMQDLVNHLIRQVKLEFKERKIFDYIFIDEIQDLTISEAYLLLLLTKNPKIFAGDTCQTISSINRFRFSDLKNIFFLIKNLFECPNVSDALLSLNYRLNSKLLKLSTFISYLIRELFPNTLDKFKDDFSVKITNFKPVFLKDINNFMTLLSNKGNNILNRQNLTFSYYHCFICRSDKTAKSLSKQYNQSIYTTDILKSKGLEFEIVIVYNFFTESNYKEIWNLIFRKIKLKTNEDLKSNGLNILNEALNDFELEYLLNHNELFDEGLNKDEIKDKILKEFSEFIFPDLDIEFDKHKFFGFCAELKQFYVIITRAQTFLIFYEDENKKENRNEFYNFCIENNFIEEDKENYNSNNENNLNDLKDEMNKYGFWERLVGKPLNEQLNAYFTKRNLLIKDLETFKKLAQEEFSKGNYAKSSYLFKKTGDEIMFQKSEIFELYEEIKLMTNNPDRNIDVYKNLNNEVLDKINNLGKDYYEEFKEIFAECLFNVGKYEDAIKIYEEKKEYEKIAKIYYENIKDYNKAFEYFDKYNNIDFACKALSKLDKLDKLFNYANKNSEKLGLIEYNNLYKLYSNEYFLKIIKKQNKNRLISTIQFPPLKFININDDEKKNSDIFIPESYEHIDTYYKTIYNFFNNYCEQTKIILKENNENINDDKINLINKKRRIDTAIKELINNQSVINFIDAFYYKKKKSIYDLIIYQFPEIYFYKTKYCKKEEFFEKIFLKKKHSNFYFQNSITSTKAIQKIFTDAEIDKINFIKMATELLLYNGYVKEILNIFDNETQIIISSILSDENKMNEIKDYFENERNSIEKRIYTYFSWFKYYITKNFKNKDLEAFNIFPRIKNILMIALEKKLSENVDISFNIEDIKKLNIYLQKKEYDSFNVIKEMIEIGCEISLKFMVLNIQECEIQIFEEDVTKQTYEFFKELYKLINNVLSYSKKNSNENNKEIIVYSLFTCIGVLPLPNFDFKLFDIFSKLNFSILNSFNLLSNFYTNYPQLIAIKKNFEGIFDNEGNNLIINQEDIFNIFSYFLRIPLKNFYEKIYENLEYPLDYFNKENDKSFCQYYYFPISYYYYYVIDEFSERTEEIYTQNTNLFKSIYIYPFDYENDTFNLYQYILSLFFYEINNPKSLIRFCSNALYRITEYKKYDFNTTINNIALILLLLEENWNFKFIFQKNILSNINIFFYGKDSPNNNNYINVINHIKEDVSPLLKMIWCKNLLNFNLKFLERNFNKEKLVFYDFEENKIKKGKCILCKNNEFYQNDISGILFKKLFEIFKSYIKDDGKVNEENYYGWNNQFFNLNMFCIYLTLLNFTQNIEINHKISNYLKKINKVIKPQKPEFEQKDKLNLYDLFYRKKQLYIYNLNLDFYKYFEEYRIITFKSYSTFLEESKRFVYDYQKQSYYLKEVFKSKIDISFLENPFFFWSNDDYENKIKLIKYNIKEEFDDKKSDEEMKYNFNVLKENESMFRNKIYNADCPHELQKFLKGDYSNDSDYLYDFVFIYTHYNIEVPNVK